jgi:CDP-paratose 2-epimerase
VGTIANRHAHHVLITGGAGFIGTNLAAHLLANTDATVTVFDDLSRPGVELNLAWLKTLAGARRLHFVRGDVRNPERIAHAARTADEIYHLAAPSAGPDLLLEPRLDFDVNVNGTINVLEAARLSGRRPFVMFASTGKVYGTFDGIPLRNGPSRLEPVDPDFRGISETTPAPRVWPTSMSGTTPGITDCVRWRSGWDASPVLGSSETRDKGGWHILCTQRWRAGP